MMRKDDPPPRERTDSESLLASFGFDAPGEPWMERLRGAEAPMPYGALGPYELVEEVSRGGQGIVYRALTGASKRQVAVKRLLSGPFASASTRRRFELEIEALRSLDHPSIVSALDLEVIDGALVLVMEWIEGVSITEWATQDGRRSPEESARMMLKVCEAVRHAHQHGILHRDLKPSNVLIDPAGEPHVIDFGLAKVISPGAEDSPTLTDQFVGTTSYASLEQLYGDASAVDVRADVYSLGVILYELVSSRLPYEREASPAAAARAIEEGQPTPLSSVVPRLDRNLAAVTLKAVARRKEDRYTSVEAFTADLHRYLSKELVEARPAGAWARFLQSARRHPVGMSFAATVFLLVTVFGITAASLAAENAAERDAANEDRKRAVEEAAKARAIAVFLHRMLASVQPGMQGQDVTVREVLDNAAQQIGMLSDQLLVQADLRNTIGMSYQQLGLYEEAESHLRASMALLSEHGGTEADLAQLQNNLGLLLADRGDYAGSEELLRQSLEIRRRVLEEGDFFIAESLNNLAGSAQRRGQNAEAAEMLREALDIQRGVWGERHPRVAMSLNNLAHALEDTGRYTEAETLYRESLALHRSMLGDEHPDVAGVLTNLGRCLSSLEDYSAAEGHLQEALSLLRASAGEEHPSVASCLDVLTGVALRQEKYGEAEPLARESLSIRRAALGRHPLTAASLNNLARVLADDGRPEEAEPLHLEALAIARELLSPDHWYVAAFRGNYGRCLGRLRRFQEAESELLHAYDSLSATFGVTHERPGKAARYLAELYEAWDRPELVKQWCEREQLASGDE